MSTFSAFRSIAVNFLHLNTRRNAYQALQSLGLCSVASTRISYRHFHESHSRGAWVKNNQTLKDPVAGQQTKAKEQKLKEIGSKDHDIPYSKVQVSSPQGLSDFRTLKDVLAEVERLNAPKKEGETRSSLKRYHAQLVANDPGPIVRFIDSKEEFRKQKAAQERAKNNAMNKVRKEVQLTWASSGADVGTGLGGMKDDLERGFKVDLVIMPKKNVRPPRQEDMQARADEFVTHFSDTAKEWKERDCTRTTVVMYFQGILASQAGAAGEEFKGDKIPKRRLAKEQRRQKEKERLRKKQELEERSRSNFPEENDILPP